MVVYDRGFIPPRHCEEVIKRPTKQPSYTNKLRVRFSNLKFVQLGCHADLGGSARTDRKKEMHLI